MANHPLVEGLELRRLLAAKAVTDLAPVEAAPSPPPRSILADLNHDGRADQIVVAHNILASDASSSAVLRMILGNGDGTFAPSDAVSFNYNTAVAVAAGDLNGDGLVDVSVVGENPLSERPSGVNVYVVTFLGNGDGRFKRTAGPTANADQPPVTFTTFIPGVSRVNGLVVGDLDGSKFGDVAVLGQLHSTVGTTTNPPIGAVVAWDPSRMTPGVAPTTLTFPTLTSVDRLYRGDLDGDGNIDLVAVRSTPLPPTLLTVVRPDLVTVRFSTSRLADVRARSNPLYLHLTTPITTAAALPTTFGLDNVDGDHVPDLVGTGGTSSIRYASFVRSTTGGSFSAAKPAISLGLRSGAVLRDLRIGDLNNDGLADLLASANVRSLVGLNITGHSPLANPANLATFAWSPILPKPALDVLGGLDVANEPRSKASLEVLDVAIA